MGDWGGYGAIVKDAAADAAADRAKPPIACPIDGEPLQKHPTKAVWNCPLGNYRTTSQNSGN